MIYIPVPYIPKSVLFLLHRPAVSLGRQETMHNE